MLTNLATKLSMTVEHFYHYSEASDNDSDSMSPEQEDLCTMLSV